MVRHQARVEPLGPMLKALKNMAKHRGPRYEIRKRPDLIDSIWAVAKFLASE